MTWQVFLIRLVVAIFVGTMIGFERQWRHGRAGLRTNVLVSLGAFLFVVLSFMSMKDASTTRVAANVVTGIGFLGAGVIIHEGLSVRGLNTAATLWCTAAAGTLCASGFLQEAIFGAAGVVSVNIFLRSVAIIINKNANNYQLLAQYIISASCTKKEVSRVRGLLKQLVDLEKLKIQQLISENIEKDEQVKLNAHVYCETCNHSAIERIVSQLNFEKGILSIGWQIAEAPNFEDDA